jgi:hypothetical protein
MQSALHLLAAISELHAIRNNPQREPRDFSDIVEVVRANPGHLGNDELSGLCEKYGPEGLRERLETVLWKKC